jgi:hypothetical protein
VGRDEPAAAVRCAAFARQLPPAAEKSVEEEGEGGGLGAPVRPSRAAREREMQNNLNHMKRIANYIYCPKERIKRSKVNII